MRRLEGMRRNKPIHLLALCLLIGAVGLAALACGRQPAAPPLSPSGATPSPTSAPVHSPSATPAPTPTHTRAPTPTPGPHPALPTEAVAPENWPALPADLYFIRAGSLWRWSAEGGLQQIVAAPEQDSGPSGGTSHPGDGETTVPTGITAYRLTPDGRYLVYMVHEKQAQYYPAVIFLDLVSGQSVHIPGTGDSLPCIPQIEITPDGRYLVYPARGTTLTAPPPSTPSDEKCAAILAVAPGNPNHKIELGYCAGPSGQDDDEPACRGFGLAPDGSRVAFVDGRGLWLSDVPEGEPRSLLEQRGDPFPNCTFTGWLQWSPEGKYLLAEMICFMEVGGLVRIETDTGAAREIQQTFRHIGFVSVSWGRGGRELEIGRTDFVRGVLEIVSMEDPAHSIEILSGRHIWPTYPKELPDGRIALANQVCQSSDGLQPGIYTVDRESRDLQLISSLPVVSCRADFPSEWGKLLWSPDGRAYLYLWDRQPLLLGLSDGSALWDVWELLADAHTFQWKPPLDYIELFNSHSQTVAAGPGSGRCSLPSLATPPTR